MLNPSTGRRAGVPGTVVILADGPSGDDAIGAARELKTAGKTWVMEGGTYEKTERRTCCLKHC